MIKHLNTPENKAKFFATHFGCSFTNNNKLVERISGGMFLRQAAEGDAHLNLKPLSAISDEDARIITLMHLGLQSAPSENIMFAFKNTVYPLLSDVSRMQSRIADFLRSKGYLIGWMDLTPEDILAFEWARLEGEG